MRIFTDEWREKISISLKNRYKDKTKHPMYGKKRTSESKDKMSKIMSGRYMGAKNPNWRGGKYIGKDYWYIFKPDHPNCNHQGYIAEHRIIMENKLGRMLNKSEIVHHINHIKTDNRLENLMLIESNGTHSKLHYKQRNIDNLGRLA